MTGAWTINVEGRVYGPFASDKMFGFVSEGRLAPHSLVAREGTTDWHEARREPEFVEIFARRQPSAAPATASRSPAAAATASPSPVNGTAQEPGRAHFVVVVDQKSLSQGNFEDTVGSLGPSYRLSYNVWIISTDMSVSAVRNRLVQELGKADSLFVIDASRGKAAWFNFGPEADAHIRRVWQKTT